MSASTAGGSSDSQTAALALAQRFHGLSVEYNNRPVVVRRGTLPSLVKLLRHPSWEVRHIAAKTIELLAAHPENPEFMCREKGFVQVLFDSYKDSESSDPELHTIFSSIFHHLRTALGTDTENGGVGEHENDGHIAEDNSIRTAKNRGTRVRQTASTSRRVVISVAGLNDRRVVADIEDLLQTTRGVVSYTVDPTSSSVQLFTAMPTGTLLHLLQGHDFECHIVSDENIGGDGGNTTHMGGGAMPSYARSLREPSGHASSGDNGGLASAFRRSLVLHGTETNTLAARVAREKEEERRKQLESQRSSVTGFLTRLAKSWW